MVYLAFRASPLRASRLGNQLREFLKDLLKWIVLRRRIVTSSEAVPLHPVDQGGPGLTLLRFQWPPPRQCHINGRPVGLERRLSRRWCLLDRSHFWDWENIVSLRRPFRLGRVEILPVLSQVEDANWRPEMDRLEAQLTRRPTRPTGRLLCLSERGRVLASRNLGAPPKASDPAWDRAGPAAPESAALRFLRGSRIESGEFAGSFHGAWDFEARSFRLASWVWTSGVVVHALLAQGSTELALETLDGLLERQLKEGPDLGAWMVRWDLIRDSEPGVVPWLAPNDVSYLAAQGLLPAFQRTGRRRYLEAARAAADWVIREGLLEDGRLLLGRRLDQNRWVRDWLYVDAGFTGELFARLFRETGDSAYRDALASFTTWYIRQFQRPDGRMIKIWRENGRHDHTPFARGHGWALAGLAAAVETFPGDRLFSDALNRLLKAVLPQQLDNGAWYYAFERPGSGECAKATAVLAYYLGEAASLPGLDAALRGECRRSVSRALVWCENRQEEDFSDEGGGGIHSWTIEGAVTGARDADVAFSYTAAFYSLAKLALIRGEKS